MTAVQNAYINTQTPMGATVINAGVTFRTWAPDARDVYLVTAADDTNGWSAWTPNAPNIQNRLFPLGDGTWAGFVPGMRDGDAYLFWIRGPAGGTEGFKRDPYARELDTRPFFPDCPCLVRRSDTYPWHDAGWRPPAFRDFIIYQLHVGVFWGANLAIPHYGKFLDTVSRIPYLRELGITAVQVLPIQEFDGDFSLGYAGLDYFSPEMVYQVEDQAELAARLTEVNRLLAEKNCAPVTQADLLPGPNQLKCLIDLLHLNGIAVIFDLVYNHAGGGFGERSLWYYDRHPWEKGRDSRYFTTADWAGGMVFDYGQAGVRQYLIDNALFFLREYRIDGIRYDEVTVIHWNGGDRFCQDLTATVRHAKPEALQIAEYWDWDRAKPVTPPPHGLGFDAALGDRLRDAVRGVLAEAATGAGTHVHLDAVRAALMTPSGFSAPWTVVQCLENHDHVRWDYGESRPRNPRIPALADPSNPRSRYAVGRTRVATALLLTAPGIPMIFMGQEILEDKPWHDDIRFWSRFMIWWDGLGAPDPAMREFLWFMQGLIRLRHRYPALRGDGIGVPQVHETDRVIVVHRWVEGEGRDVVVVASLNEQPLHAYPVEMPGPGRWLEIFNTGNGSVGEVRADGLPGQVYPNTARIDLPAMGALIFARE